MEFSDKHTVIILLIIIIFTFIYNYDIYVVKKGQELCKPVFVTKRIISPEIQSQLSNNNNIEKFSNLPLPNISNINLSYIQPSKINTIYNVISVIKNTPSDLSNDEIINILEFYFYVFNSSSSIQDFYSNLSKSNLINQSPYNSNYAKLVLYLLSEFSCDSYKSNNNTISNFLNNDIDLVFPNNIDNKNNINNIDNIDNNKNKNNIDNEDNNNKNKNKNIDNINNNIDKINNNNNNNKNNVDIAEITDSRIFKPKKRICKK
jgi:hypothetical protein